MLSSERSGQAWAIYNEISGAYIPQLGAWVGGYVSQAGDVWRASNPSNSYRSGMTKNGTVDSHLYGPPMQILSVHT